MARHVIGNEHAGQAPKTKANAALAGAASSFDSNGNKPGSRARRHH